MGNDHSVLIIANHQLLAALEEALADLCDKHIHYHAPLLDERSIRDVAIHAYRPVLAAVAVVADQPWPPRPLLPTSLRDLQTLLRSMHIQIDAWLTQLPHHLLVQPVTLRWGAYATGAEAITGSLTHGFVHTGAIRGIRAIGGFPCPPEGA